MSNEGTREVRRGRPPQGATDSVRMHGELAAMLDAVCRFEATRTAEILAEMVGEPIVERFRSIPQEMQDRTLDDMSPDTRERALARLNAPTP